MTVALFGKATYPLNPDALALHFRTNTIQLGTVASTRSFNAPWREETSEAAAKKVLSPLGHDIVRSILTNYTVHGISEVQVALNSVHLIRLSPLYSLDGVVESVLPVLKRVFRRHGFTLMTEEEHNHRSTAARKARKKVLMREAENRLAHAMKIQYLQATCPKVA